MNTVVYLWTDPPEGLRLLSGCVGWRPSPGQAPFPPTVWSLCGVNAPYLQAYGFFPRCLPQLFGVSFCTCHHERAYALHPALHGGFHQGGEGVAVPPLDVQPWVVVEQVVGDRYVTLKAQEEAAPVYACLGLCTYSICEACVRQHVNIRGCCVSIRTCTLPA